MALLFTGCGEPLPSDAEFRAAFQQEYPDAEIVKVDYDGEDASTSYIRFHYRLRGQQDIIIETWQFTDSGEGKKKRVMIPPKKV